MASYLVLKSLFYFYSGVYVYAMSAHCSWSSEDTIRSPGARVIGSCELPYVDVGNPTFVPSSRAARVCHTHIMSSSWFSFKIKTIWYHFFLPYFKHILNMITGYFKLCNVMVGWGIWVRIILGIAVKNT